MVENSVAGLAKAVKHTSDKTIKEVFIFFNYIRYPLERKTTSKRWWIPQFSHNCETQRFHFHTINANYTNIIIIHALCQIYTNLESFSESSWRMQTCYKIVYNLNVVNC